MTFKRLSINSAALDIGEDIIRFKINEGPVKLQRGIYHLGRNTDFIE